MDRELNPEQINVDGSMVSLQEYMQEHEELIAENARLKSNNRNCLLYTSDAADDDYTV